MGSFWERTREKRLRGLAPLWCAGLLACLVAGAALGQEAPASQEPAVREAEGLRAHAITLVHRRAVDALQIAGPLLSARGSIELQSGNNTLVVRDTLASLTRIVSAVRAFDRPARPVTLDLELLRGERLPSPAGQQGLESRLAPKIRSLLPYQQLVGLARARLAGREGEAIDYELHGGYRVSFAFGNWMNGQGIRLQGFRVLRLAPNQPRELVGTSLHVRPSQPIVLALTRDEASERALLVILELSPPGESGS